MTITFPSDSTHTVTTDGKSFILQPEGITFTGLADMAFTLTKMGIISKEDHQLGEDARWWCNHKADALMDGWIGSEENAVAKRATVTFNADAFRAVAVKPCLWVLFNPAQSVRCSDLSFSGQRCVVDRCPSLRLILDLAVTRMFHARPGSIAYTDLDKTLMDLAAEVTSDAEVQSVGVDGTITAMPALIVPPIGF